MSETGCLQALFTILLLSEDCEDRVLEAALAVMRHFAMDNRE